MKPKLALLCMQAVCALAFPANRSFDIVYINLECSKARRVHVERMLKYANCSFRRFNAVDGRELCSKRKSVLDYTGGISIAPTDSSIQQQINTSNAGRAGCHLSHLIVLRQIDVSDTDRPVLVLEDDIDLDEHFAKKVEDVVADPPDRWDIVLLGGVVSEKWWRRRHSKHLVEVRYRACLHAYLLNGARSARKVADAIDTSKCPGTPVDLIIADAFIYNNSFVFYCFSPMIAVQKRDLFGPEFTVLRPTSLYMRYLGNQFQSAYLRPLWSSLSRAAASGKGTTEQSFSQLAPLIAFLLPIIGTHLL